MKSMRAATNCPSATKAEQAVAVVVYTSGTTGSSKGVMLTNECLASAADMLAMVDEKNYRNLVFLGIIAFFSSYGVSCGMHNHLRHGCRLVLIPIFKPADYRKADHKTQSFQCARGSEVLGRFCA
jgi:long-chain acyl-CoA synthetase